MGVCDGATRLPYNFNFHDSYLEVRLSFPYGYRLHNKLRRKPRREAPDIFSIELLVSSTHSSAYPVEVELLQVPGSFCLGRRVSNKRISYVHAVAGEETL